MKTRRLTSLSNFDQTTHSLTNTNNKMKNRERERETEKSERKKQIAFVFFSFAIKVEWGLKREETNKFDTSVLTDNERCPLLRFAIQMTMNLVGEKISRQQQKRVIEH